MRTKAKLSYFLEKGFTEDKYGYYKGDFSLMKTTLGIFLEVLYKHKIIKKITRTVEDIEEIYLELTSNKL